MIFCDSMKILSKNLCFNVILYYKTLTLHARLIIFIILFFLFLYYTESQQHTHLAPGPAAPLVDHSLACRVLRLRPVLPVEFALVQIEREYRHVGDLGLVAARLQQ